MTDTTLPIHVASGDRAVGWRKARRGETGPQPIWPIRGGSGDGDEAGEASDDKATDVDVAADQGDDTKGDADASEVDWQAKAKELESKFAAQQRINRTLERRTKADKNRIEELEGTKKPAATDTKADAEVDVEKIRAEARAEAAKEALQERVLDKIELKAAKDFADPADAVAMLMRVHKVDDFLDDGKPDVEAIQDALKELLEKKPYLGAAAQGGKNRFQGSAEGGAKPTKPARPKSLDEAVRRALTP